MEIVKENLLIYLSLNVHFKYVIVIYSMVSLFIELFYKSAVSTDVSVYLFPFKRMFIFAKNNVFY